MGTRNESEYEKEYLMTCETVNDMVLKKWPGSAGAALAWAAENKPDLYKKDVRLERRINTEWINAIEIETFRRTVLEWGRNLLKIYKLHAESCGD